MQIENMKPEGHEDHKENFVQVAVVTTSGAYPDEGFVKTPLHQKVRIVLAEATRELKIADANGWIATVENRELDLEKNYFDNGLSGKVEIDFGPREGGGGNA